MSHGAPRLVERPGTGVITPSFHGRRVAAAPVGSAAVRFTVAARSDIGNVRANNEDAYAASDRLVAVSDGVGGRPAGEVASGIAVAVVTASVARGLPVEEAVEAANEVVRAASETSSLFSGMCCTVTAATAQDDGQVVVAHVGDSKAWLVRASTGKAERLTEDQTITARMVRDGELTPEQALTHPKRSTLYQVVGQSKPLDRCVAVLDDLVPGDRLILATDGLDYGRERALDLLAEPLQAEALVTALVQSALDGGGNDNITVVVADLVAGDR